MQFSLASLFVVTAAAGLAAGAVRVVATIYCDLSATPGDSLFLAGISLVGFITAVAVAAVFSDL